MKADLFKFDISAYQHADQVMIGKVRFYLPHSTEAVVIYDENLGLENLDFAGIIMLISNVSDEDTLSAFLLECLSIIRQRFDVEIHRTPSDERMGRDSNKSFVYYFVGEAQTETERVRDETAA